MVGSIANLQAAPAVAPTAAPTAAPAAAPAAAETKGSGFTDFLNSPTGQTTVATAGNILGNLINGGNNDGNRVAAAPPGAAPGTPGAQPGINGPTGAANLSGDQLTGIVPQTADNFNQALAVQTELQRLQIGFEIATEALRMASTGIQKVLQASAAERRNIQAIQA